MSVCPSRSVRPEARFDWRAALIVAVFALLVSSGMLAAQAIAPAGVSRGDSAKHAPPPPDGSFTHEASHGSTDAGVRVLAGVLGAVGGTVGGAALGSALSSGCRGELCQLGPAILGAAAGSVVGAALGSALPSLQSACQFDNRMSRAVGGGLLGALAGGTIGLLGGPLSIATYIVGSGVGAGIAAATC